MQKPSSRLIGTLNHVRSANKTEKIVVKDSGGVTVFV